MSMPGPEDDRPRSEVGQGEHEPHPVERRDVPPGVFLLVGLVVLAIVWFLAGER